MRALLELKLGPRFLALMTIGCVALWWRSTYLLIKSLKTNELSLFWSVVLYFGPAVGLILSAIVASSFASQGYQHKLWAITGILAGLSPAACWIYLWLGY
jgi:branched-subunit amino acid transport protein